MADRNRRNAKLEENGQGQKFRAHILGSSQLTKHCSGTGARRCGLDRRQLPCAQLLYLAEEDSLTPFSLVLWY